MLKFYSLLFAGLAVLSVVGFVGFAAWCGAKEAATILKKLWKSWRGRQVSSAKDRIKRVVRVLVLFALTSSASATLNTSQEVIGPHKNWTPVAGPPVIVKFSTDYTGPTATPTPTFTWNATTTRTQPPTATPTATNTPVAIADGYYQWSVDVTPGWSSVTVVLDGTYSRHCASVVYGAGNGGTYGGSVTTAPRVVVTNSGVFTFPDTSTAPYDPMSFECAAATLRFTRSYGTGATPTPGTGTEQLYGYSWGRVK